MSTAQQEDAAVWSEVEAVLEQLVPEDSVDVTTLYKPVDQLFAVLKRGQVNSGRAKSTILRSLFRLLDSEDPHLLIKAIKVVLLVRPLSVSMLAHYIHLPRLRSQDRR